MTTRQMVEGVQILLPFYNKKDGFHINAGSDVIYMNATDKSLPNEVVQKMISLSWHQEYDGRDYDEDFGIDDYREDEDWQFYV